MGGIRQDEEPVQDDVVSSIWPALPIALCPEPRHPRRPQAEQVNEQSPGYSFPG